VSRALEREGIEDAPGSWPRCSARMTMPATACEGVGTTFEIELPLLATAEAMGVNPT
jgi:hypothetical protein